jgi:hypothetical protein
MNAETEAVPTLKLADMPAVSPKVRERLRGRVIAGGWLAAGLDPELDAARERHHELLQLTCVPWSPECVATRAISSGRCTGPASLSSYRKPSSQTASESLAGVARQSRASESPSRPDSAGPGRRIASHASLHHERGSATCAGLRLAPDLLRIPVAVLTKAPHIAGSSAFWEALARLSIDNGSGRSAAPVRIQRRCRRRRRRRHLGRRLRVLLPDPLGRGQRRTMRKSARFALDLMPARSVATIVRR